MDSPLVSIIAPCYNGEYYLPRFLDSIINQTYGNLEVIIINDGSTDKTIDVLNSYKEKFDIKNMSFILLNQENKGQASALNNGLKYFKGEYLCCVDSDDKLSEDYVESKLKFMLKNPNVAYCYGNIIFIDEKTNKIIKRINSYNLIDKKSFFNNIIYAKNIFFPGYMFRTSCFDKVIKNREIYDGKGGQNAQLLLPFAWYYGNPYHIDKSIYYYYVNENSHSHSINTSEKIIIQMENYEKILDNTLMKIDNIRIKKIIDEYHVYYARIKFGNAVDSLDANLIEKYFMELFNLKCFTLHDFLLYLKYRSNFFNKFHKYKENSMH